MDEYWLNKFLNKEIRKTEMYFILKLKDKFEIKEIRPKKMLSYLMSEEIKEIASFIKFNMSYTLNILEKQNEPRKIIITTNNINLLVVGELRKVFGFMKKELKYIYQINKEK